MVSVFDDVCGAFFRSIVGLRASCSFSSVYILYLAAALYFSFAVIGFVLFVFVLGVLFLLVSVAFFAPFAAASFSLEISERYRYFGATWCFSSRFL